MSTQPATQVYYGRDIEILGRRDLIKRNTTMLLRRRQNHSLILAEKAENVYMSTETFSSLCPKPFEDVQLRELQSSNRENWQM